MQMDIFHRSTILVVDDTPHNARIVYKVLTGKNCEVLIAEDGRSALAVAQSEHPDLILLDIMMPELDGFETCILLKQNKETRDIPVIFMTALSDLENKVRGFEVGAVDYVTKPFQQKELVARIQTHLTIRQLQRELLIQKSALEKANEELKCLAIIDDLTQVANRRRLEDYLQKEWKRGVREKISLSVILCDIDFFKQYNDTYGHVVGDECLKQVAQAINQAVKRPADLVARYGGEEFMVILPYTPLEGALKVARDIQKTLQSFKIIHDASTINQYITLSFGIANTIPESVYQPITLIKAADSALYKAKQNGRNCIVTEYL